MATNTYDVWPHETGILDLPEDWSSLSVPSVTEIAKEWSRTKSELAGSEGLHTFTEQLHREWAIETGIIENLYDIERGVTQTLIEQGFTSAILEHGSTNRDREYVLALLRDQQAALEGLFAFVKQDRPLSTSYIKELHAVMTQSQPTTEAFTPSGDSVVIPLLRGEWKVQPNFPSRNGVQIRYCPPEQTAPEIERLVSLHLQHEQSGVAPEVSAAWLHHRFTQIHPFQDGNGRVARALASLVLIKAGLFPLVVPRDEKSVYLESLELADQGKLRSLTLLIARRVGVAYSKSATTLRRSQSGSKT